MHKTKSVTARRPMRAEHRHTRQKRHEESAGGFRLPQLAKSLAVTAAVGMVALLAASLLAYFLPDPTPWIRPLALLAAALTALIGGATAARLQKENAALCGLLNGCVCMAGMILLSLFFRSRASGDSTLVSILFHASFLLCSVVGGMLGKRKPYARHLHP